MPILYNLLIESIKKLLKMLCIYAVSDLGRGSQIQRPVGPRPGTGGRPQDEERTKYELRVR